MPMKAEEVLKNLVLIKSTSEDPAGPIVDHVSEMLRGLGLEPRSCGDSARPAILAQHLEGGVALSGHLDTVPLGTGWSRGQAEMADGVMYGRGSADMKAGCTAMLLSAERLIAKDVPFSLCFTTDEETTMIGAETATKDHAIRTAPAVLVAEPSNFEIITKEKGLLHFAISTSGRAAHASMPHLGENAILKMIKLLSRLDDLQRIPDDPRDELTMCVDTIQGGTRINVIPRDCKVEIDVRYPPPMDTQTVLGLVKDRIGDQVYDLKILHELPPVETDASSHAVRALKDLIGPEAKVSSVPYATEMVMFSAGNPTVMVCGPGDPRMAHVIDEGVALADIARAAELYVRYCTAMARK